MRVTGSATPGLDQVASTVCPPEATSASPVPVITVSGTAFPAWSRPADATIRTRRTTTFSAASTSPAADVDGVPASSRSQRCVPASHVHDGEVCGKRSRTAAAGSPPPTAVATSGGTAKRNCSGGGSVAAAWRRKSAGRP